MDILYENIKRLRKQLKMSQGDLAKKTGYTDRSSIAKIENGEVDLSQSRILAFADALHVTPQYLMGYDNVQIHLQHLEAAGTIPIYGDISCGSGMFSKDNIIDTISVPLSMLPDQSAKYFAQYAVGNSMSGAGICDGDLLVFRKTSQIKNGQIGSFCIDENAAICRKFSRIGGSIYLIPANDDCQPIPIEPENTCFHVAGLYVMQIKRVK